MGGRGERFTDWKKENYLPLFTDDMIIYVENSKESTKKNPEINKGL